MFIYILIFYNISASTNQKLYSTNNIKVAIFILTNDNGQVTYVIGIVTAIIIRIRVIAMVSNTNYYSVKKLDGNGNSCVPVISESIV